MQPVSRSAYACLDDRGMAMARVSMEVPAELVGPIQETVFLLHQATTESLQLAFTAHAEGRGSLEEVREHRERLAQLDELVAALGRPADAATVALRAPADVLHDAFYGALNDAGERLAVTADRCWRAELRLEDVQAAADEVLRIHALLRRLEERR
jgi:hypothetical protein